MKDRAGTRSIRITQALWVMVALAGSVIFAAGPVYRWTALQTACHPDSACLSFQLDAGAAATLSAHGVSLHAYALCAAVVLASFWILWYGLAVLIILRKADDRGALLAAFFLVVFPVWSVTAWIPGVLSSVLTGVFIAALLLFGLLFPDAHFAPRWTRWLAGAVVVVFLVTALPVPAVLNGLAIAMFVGILLSVIAAQIHRYRFVSSWTQRQQTKWGIFGLAVAIFGINAIWFGAFFLPFRTGTGSLYGALTDVVGVAIVVSAIPLSIGVAVLRNRLWDIDRVINRALVYVSLTGTLAAIYIGSVLGLQALFRAAVGTSSSLAIALSTLAIAALFGPLRHRIQHGIDRRFYRSKYDAERILAVFGERLRDEVDLAQLSQDLTHVVKDSLHPEHVSLWLRDRGHATGTSTVWPGHDASTGG